MNTSIRKSWTRDELILAINLYCRTPFGRIHVRNPDIIALAESLGRTPGSVSYKLANFASIDPSLDRKGAANTSKLDREVWNEFFENWETMAFESEMLMAKLTKIAETGEESAVFEEGKTRTTEVQARVKQGFFRKMVLSSYDERCCITGIRNAELLNASHIIPWARDVRHRLNPMNGLCLNALHDRAFDRGLITLDQEFRVVVSGRVEHDLLRQYDHHPITLPQRFIPDQEFLDVHRNEIFQG